MEQDTGFTTEGKDKLCPDFHLDRQKLSDISTWPTGRLADKMSEYEDYLNQEDNLPHQIEKARQIMEHLLFELIQRDDYDISRMADEVCEGA